MDEFGKKGVCVCVGGGGGGWGWGGETGLQFRSLFSKHRTSSHSHRKPTFKLNRASAYSRDNLFRLGFSMVCPSIFLLFPGREGRIKFGSNCGN